MTHTADHKNFALYASYDVPKRNAIMNFVGSLRRTFSALLEAMDESRRRHAEREIARYVDLRGGRMTDEAEREIGRRLFPPIGSLAIKKSRRRLCIFGSAKSKSAQASTRTLL